MIDKIIDFDQSIFLFLNNLGSETWDPFWILISNKLCMFFFLFFVVFSQFNKADKRLFMYQCIFLILCISLTDFLHVHLFKNIFMRLRPCWDVDIAPLTRILVNKGGQYGFISGHAANATAIVTFFILIFKNINHLLKYSLFIWLFLILYSRIYLGKHYPLDVLCGLFFGLIMGFLCYKFYKTIFYNRVL